ncbi:2-aminoethylphosphonate--pyruvate transaminase [Metabacillus iocasae]|uniref:2-aminoethylphosphonate--pyruvate transaminase n=1 Tax=Priestia iocasae TaxID=2291674 RepID=A0ABS2QXY6_9BACI|nr:2-aminoethylphosphonate--pyruvate transaminase [Metabacillus iocasae]MBM7704354.1 2-aminoethylphosphonate-pyruvate transaminase [Metabacillus iocasae]
MSSYKLLTPGPLTTSRAVKEQMLVDRCTWDDDYKAITQKIRRQLLGLAHVPEHVYTTVLMQGSGTFVVEAVLNTCLGPTDKALIITNGAYGERLAQIAAYNQKNFCTYALPYNAVPEGDVVEDILKGDQAITHVVMVHCETTTGMLNPVEMVANIAKRHGKIVIIDAMSSFGGIPMHVEDLQLDFVISSANKCIQGVPGFGFVVAKKEQLLACEGNATSLSLDLVAQWKEMDKDGKWRYTSPTHVVAAFSKALDELEEEGGVQARYTRYRTNNATLRKEMEKLGFHSYIAEVVQSPIITTFLFPSSTFSFKSFYEFIKARGYVIYPGKLTNVDTFRIGNIGDIHEEDMIELVQIIADYQGGKIDA